MAGTESYKIYVYGKHDDPVFQKYKAAAEYLASEIPSVEATVEGFFETQYEQQLKQLVRQYGGQFAQVKDKVPIIFAETTASILFFAESAKFFEWALRRFKYEDTTHTGIYRQMGSAAKYDVQTRAGRSYVSLNFDISDPVAKQEKIEAAACMVKLTGLPTSTLESVDDAVTAALQTFGPIISIGPESGGTCCVTFDSAEAATSAKQASPMVGGAQIAIEEVKPEPVDTVEFELFDEECPNLCENFRNVLAHQSFNGHKIHRVKTGAWIQGGDIKDSSGKNSEGAKGGYLRHESFMSKHDRPGLLGMCCHGQDTIGSQYYVTLRDLPFLDGSFVVIGRVISGMQAINMIGKTPTKNERPISDVTVAAAKV